MLTFGLVVVIQVCWVCLECWADRANWTILGDAVPEASTQDGADLVLPEGYVWNSEGLAIAGESRSGRILGSISLLIGFVYLLTVGALAYREWLR